jgi:hypothetical protein
MARYAANTEVSSSKSRDEIERTLVRYGAGGFIYGWQDDKALIAFTMEGRQIRFLLPLPRADDPAFCKTEGGQWRTETEAKKRFDQATRQRWRALLLIIKAKLEAIESGIVTFEDEFLAHTVLPTGETAGDWMKPQIADAYLTGKMPALLPMLPAPEKP